MGVEPYIAEVVLFAGNFPPRGWAFCDGQLLPIAQNTALFSLIGTTYGGDGRTTFALPDLRGRVPVHAGASAGPGLARVNLGEMGGAATHTLQVAELPAHTHATDVAAGEQTTNRATDGSAPARGGVYGTPDAPGRETRTAGGSQPHNNMQPYLGLNYIIALEGIFPPRS